MKPKSATCPKEKRVKNTQEVSLGISRTESLKEARRCPQCSDPVCVSACPLGVDIPGFIRLLREGEASAALKKIREKNPLPGICGRICHAPCETACVLNEENGAIGIRLLERYAYDWGRKKMGAVRKTPSSGKKVAVVGSGPAGLMAAVCLVEQGHRVSVFESLPEPGGMLRYGIPEYRLPRDILDDEVALIRQMGVEIKTSWHIAEGSMIHRFWEEGYAAVLLALGAGSPKPISLPGAHCGGVYYGEELSWMLQGAKRYSDLYSESLPLGRKIVVFGSHMAALDAARSCVRLNREVLMIFPETQEDLPLPLEEREYAKEEGVRMEGLVMPVEILANDRHCVEGIRCVRMDYADPDYTDHWQLIPVPDSDFVIETDTVIWKEDSAVPVVFWGDGAVLRRNPDGSMWSDEATSMTSQAGVFLAGDCAGAEKHVVAAMGSGKRAAAQIDIYLKSKAQEMLRWRM
jgi:glutamate synthase (NADPH/NADH) small chain